MAYSHKKLKEEIDNYNDTVWATAAFAHECSWNQSTKSIDDSVRTGIGRAMIRLNVTEVTPDIVIQRRPTEGILAEVKHTFPPQGEEGRRDEIFQQLKNYDAEMRGW